MQYPALSGITVNCHSQVQLGIPNLDSPSHTQLSRNVSRAEYGSRYTIAYDHGILSPGGTLGRSMKLTEAENQLLALLRGEHAKDFSVEIRNLHGIWHAKLIDHDANLAGHGQGDTFSKAWDDILHRSMRS